MRGALLAACLAARAARCCAQAAAAGSDGSYNCSLPGLTRFAPGLYEGVRANYMSFVTLTSSPHFKVRAEEFEACTGGRIIFSEAHNVFVDPIQDLGSRAEEGLGLADGYFMSYSHFPEASSLGLAETLNERIRRDEEYLQWADIFPEVQIMGKYRKDGQNNLDFLMFDGDFFVPIVRIDLLERHNLPLPNTWTEVIELARFFHGRDLNEDGEPDYGICHFPRRDGDYWDWWWPELIYSTWATFAQTEGHEQGFFFDPLTFEPQLDTPGFREAAKIWKQLWTYGGEGCISNNMATGRCAIGFSPPGCWKGIFLNGIARTAPNGTVLWRPTLSDGTYAEPYRLLPFGTTEVVDPATGQLTPCTRALCRHAVPVSPRGHVSDADRARILPASPLTGQLINRAPFFWSGGLGTLIRKSADADKKDLLWDFFVYLNSPATSVEDVASYSSWVDSWRFSQLTEAGENFVVHSTWSRDAYAEHRSVMMKCLGLDSNGALNLRIPYIKEYTSLSLGRHMEEFIADSITEDQLVDLVTQSWDEVTERAGLIYQLQTYRAALTMEEISEAQLCELHRSAMDAIDVRTCRAYDPPAVSDSTSLIVAVVFGSLLGAALVVAFVLWIAYTVRSKRRLVAEKKQRMESVVKESLDTVGTLKFPMVLISAADYIGLGRLLPSEELRDRPDLNLKYLDKCEDVDHYLESYVVIFLSHQWLSWNGPDPDDVQYTCSCRAIRKIIKDHGWDLSKTYIWCDYISIPQCCTAIQTLAIISLPVYSSKVSAFIIVAPRAVHLHTQMQCDVQSYVKRAWCRAEMLSHALCKGISNMYVANEEGLVSASSDNSFLKDSMFVFEGDLTCCRMKHANFDTCDREKLVVPFLGLYSYVIHTLAWKGDSMDPATKAFFERILGEKSRIFPATFEYCTECTTETRPLFRGLLELMESEVKSAAEARFEDFRLRNSMVLQLDTHASSGTVAAYASEQAGMDMRYSVTSSACDVPAGGVLPALTEGHGRPEELAAQKRSAWRRQWPPEPLGDAHPAGGDPPPTGCREARRAPRTCETKDDAPVSSPVVRVAL